MAIARHHSFARLALVVALCRPHFWRPPQLVETTPSPTNLKGRIFDGDMDHQCGIGSGVAGMDARIPDAFIPFADKRRGQCHRDGTLPTKLNAADMVRAPRTQQGSRTRSV